MDCPFCGNGTRVTRTISPDGGERIIIRERQCLDDSTHRFSTEEHERIVLSDVAVHQQSGGLVPYSRKVLRDSLAQALLVRSTPEGDGLISDLLNQVEFRIMRRTIGMKKLSEGERRHLDERARRVEASSLVEGRAWRSLRVSIKDRDIEDAVDEELAQSEKSRAYRVMYAITVKGRQGSPTNHPGWKDAWDFLRWLAEVMPTEIDSELPPRLSVHTQSIAINPVQIIPEQVVKRDGSVMRFDLDRFTRALGRALRGRREEGLKVQGVAWGTLARLVGQRTVHTAQLATVALELLRAVDEIAYLRAVVRYKRLATVSDIYAEALGLVRHPSERFVLQEPTASVFIPRPLSD